MTLRLVTPPTVKAVKIAEAKAHLRLDADISSASYGAEDAIVSAMIDAATDGLAYLNRTIIPSTWALDLAGFDDEIFLPRPPVVSVTSIVYRDAANAAVTLPTSVYEVVTDHDGHARVRLKYGQSWPQTLGSAEPVTITYTAGYDPVPAAIKAAILLRIGRIYESRDALSMTPRLRAETVDGLGRFEYQVTTGPIDTISETERHLLAPYQTWSPIDA